MQICGFVCVVTQGSEVRVNFVVMRATEEEGGRGVRRPEPQYFRRRSAYMKVGPHITGPVLVDFFLTGTFLFAQCDHNSLICQSHWLTSRTVERHPPPMHPPPLQGLVRADTCIMVWR